MNLNQLTEAYSNVLNEISDELKQKVIDKRKEQVKNAQNKLNRATRLSGIGATITINLTNPTVDVYEDSYSKGELDYVNHWRGSDVKVTLNTKNIQESFKDLLEAIFSSADCSDQEGLEHFYINFNLNENDDLMTDFFLNKDNEYPSKNEIETWKKDKLMLYTGRYSCNVEFENPEDKEVFISFLKKSGKADIN